MSAKVQKKLDIISNSLEKLPNSKLFRTFAPKYSIKSGEMPTNRPLALRLSKNQFKKQNRWQRW